MHIYIMHMYMHAHTNVCVCVCNFTDNKATFGGGAVSILRHYPLTIASDSTRELAEFENCVFQGNSAPTGGSAVGLVSNARVDQPSFSVSFEDWYV